MALILLQWPSVFGRLLDALDPVTARGLAVTQLLGVALGLSGVVVLLVAGLLVYVLARYRGRATPPAAAEPPQIAGNRRLELLYTATPALLVLVLFIFSARTLETVVGESADEAAAMPVEVIGHQWWWELRYPSLGMTTANELHLPVGAPARLAVQGADVIHSFWLPNVGWKQDAIPGKVNPMLVQVDRPGTYSGACAEFCGVQHAWMRVRLVAEPRAQFDTWAQQQAATATMAASGAAAQGQQLFLSSTCVSCHTIRGTAAHGTVGPDLTHLASRATIGAGVAPNTPDTLRRWVRNAAQLKPGVLMPSYRFSDSDLDALVAYLESLQ